MNCIAARRERVPRDDLAAADFLVRAIRRPFSYRLSKIRNRHQPAIRLAPGAHLRLKRSWVVSSVEKCCTNMPSRHGLPVQMPCQALSKLSCQQRLSQDFTYSGGPDALWPERSNVAGHQQYWQIRANLVACVGELDARDFRHDFVGQQQVKATGIDAEGGERSLAVVESDWLVPKRGQHFLAEQHKRLVVIDKQDRLTMTAASRVDQPSRHRGEPRVQGVEYKSRKWRLRRDGCAHSRRRQAR